MSEKNFLIPRTLDDPPLMFKWEMDNAIIVIVFFMLGAIMQMMIAGIFLAVVLGRGYARLKEEGGRGLITKIAYWYLPSSWISQRHPSHIREYYGG